MIISKIFCDWPLYTNGGHYMQGMWFILFSLHYSISNPCGSRILGVNQQTTLKQSNLTDTEGHLNGLARRYWI